MSDRELTPLLRLVAELQPALEKFDRARLNAIIVELLAHGAPMGDRWRQLAEIASATGELTLARLALDRWVGELGGTPAVLYQKASLLAGWDAWQEAYDLLCGLPETEPDAVANAYSRGMSLLNLGRADEAREYLERVVAVRPQTGSAWLALSMAADLGHDAALAERIVAAAEAGTAGAVPAERAAASYATGRAYEAQGEAALAFAAYSRGAGHMKPVAPYDPAADRAAAAEATRGHTPQTLAEVARAQREPTARTIFVAGLPRSGTTLVEQVLTAHSEVGAGGEINRLGLLSFEVGGPSAAALARYVESHGAGPAARLWDHWLDELFPGSRRVVDKSVISSRYLGLAAGLLPQAPLVWLTRDPLDRAWSCFKTNFAAGGMPWSYDLADIARHFRLEDDLLDQWRALLGERLLTVSYEELVREPEAVIRRLLAHCGLEEEPQVFAPHHNRRQVTTASMTQVRRPINRDAVGSADAYRAYLQPFLAAYSA